MYESSQQSCEVGTLIIPKLQTEKLRHGEIQLPPYDCIAIKGEGQDLNLGTLANMTVFASHNDTALPLEKKVR